jgi:hypothetical protein
VHEQPATADGTKVESAVFPARRLSAMHELTTDTTTNVIVNVVEIIEARTIRPSRPMRKRF